MTWYGCEQTMGVVLQGKKSIICIRKELKQLHDGLILCQEKCYIYHIEAEVICL